MKKLLLLFIPLMLFFGCEEEDTSGYNCTANGCFADAANAQYLTIEDCANFCDANNDSDDNNDSNGDWWWNITIDGNTYAAAGNCIDGTGAGAFASISSGQLWLDFEMEDITAPWYIEGGYIRLVIQVTNPFVGYNQTTLIQGYHDWADYFGSSITGLCSELSSIDCTVGCDYCCSETLDLEIFSLGSIQDSYTDCGDNFEGVLSGNVYPNSGFYCNDSNPINLSIEFSMPRM